MSRFKEWLRRRIERDAVKSELNGEIVYLKKSRMPLIGDWGRIYPPINEDDSLNGVNIIFGGHKNLLKLMIILAIVGMVYLQFAEIFRYVDSITSHQCYASFQQCINQTNSINPFVS